MAPTFMVVRRTPAVVLAPAAMDTMVLIGGFTALVMSVVMVTQSSIETPLAYSSAAHMGITLLLCGLEAFPVAILHLIAHSLYMANAVLSSESAVGVHRASRVPGCGQEPRLGAVVGVFALVIGTGAATALAFFVREKRATVVLEGAVPIVVRSGSDTIALMSIVTAAFALAAIVQRLPPALPASAVTARARALVATGSARPPPSIPSRSTWTDG